MHNHTPGKKYLQLVGTVLKQPILTAVAGNIGKRSKGHRRGQIEANMQASSIFLEDPFLLCDALISLKLSHVYTTIKRSFLLAAYFFPLQLPGLKQPFLKPIKRY